MTVKKNPTDEAVGAVPEKHPNRPTVVKLADLTTPQRRLVLALIEAAKEADGLAYTRDRRE